MQLEVKQRGNSLFILIPSAVAKAMGVSKGSVVDVEIQKVK